MSLNGKELNDYSKLTIFSRQYPGESQELPRCHTGEDGRCFSCNRKFRGNYYSAINPPGDYYIGISTENERKYLIPMAFIRLCPDCVSKNINLLTRCSWCGCVLIPGITYKVDKNLNIFCEYCIYRNRENLDTSNSFDVVFYDTSGPTDVDTMQREWSNIIKYPLINNNFNRFLFESH